jgi:palmitoyl-protein thioesterase
MGVAASPHCFSGIFCDMINFVVKKMIYFGLIQDYIGPAGYFRDPNHLDVYLKDSVFLPYVNNEKNATNEISSKFSSLNGAMLIMFSKDTMIYPKETAWFW